MKYFCQILLTTQKIQNTFVIYFKYLYFKQFTTLAITKQAVASFSHHTSSAAVQPVCCTRLMTVQSIIHFSLFDLGGLPLGQSSPKLEMTYYPPRSTILQNFSPIVQTVYEICVTNFFQKALIFDLSGHPRSNLTVLIESPWVLCINAPRVQPCICHRFRDISSQNFNIDLLTLVGLTHGPEFTKGEMTYYPPRSTILQNFSPIVQTVYEMCVTHFSVFALGG